MSALGHWAGYLSAAAIERLEALKISERMPHVGAESFTEATLRAQRDADESGNHIVIGWQMNDVTGDREPGWGPLLALNLLTLEPVAMLYPIQRTPIPCKRK